MTDIEFSRLLSDLTETARVLNRESDSINDLITRFETTIRAINLGLEVWLTTPLSSRYWAEEDEQTGRTTAEGKHVRELGFAKVGEWHLVVRVASYRRNSAARFDFMDGSKGTRLLDSSREERIEALKLFPALAAMMKSRAEDAVKAIEAAKGFVK